MKKLISTVAILAAAYLSAQQLNLLQNQRRDNYGYAEINYINPKNSLFVAKGKVDATLILKDLDLKVINEVLLPNMGQNLDKYITVINDSHIAILPQRPPSSIPGIETLDNLKYRFYDLKNNKLSEPYTLPGEHKSNSVLFDFIPIHNGFLTSTFIYDGIHLPSNPNNLMAIDNNNNVLWTHELAPNPKLNAKSIYYHKVRSNNNTIALAARNHISNGYEREEIVILDNTTGQEKLRKIMSDIGSNYYLENIKYHENKLIGIGDTSPVHKAEDGQYTGFFIMSMDEKNATTIKNFNWYDLTPYLDINEKGYVKDKGYILVHDFEVDPKTQNIILIGEYFHKKANKFYISNFVLFELDPNFNLKSVKEIPKVENQYPSKGIIYGARTLAYYFHRSGYFDYMFVNKLENNSGLTFFYHNQEKKKTVSKIGEYQYGIITYKDGIFGTDKLQYDSKTPTLIMQNKPGSFLVRQLSDTGSEMRLEKINH